MPERRVPRAQPSRTSIVVVDPSDVGVLAADRADLTLITCYPFSYLGSAPRRFIVQATRIGEPGV
jgi:sortase A